METEQLISEIERRPGIYDSGCPQYQDRVAKWTLWCEVCEIMTPRWHHLDEDRKAARGESRVHRRDLAPSAG